MVTAHAEEAAAETNAGLAKLLDFRVAIALFVVVGICLLVSLVIWRMPRSKAKGEKGSEGQEVSDKDLEALRISYGFWLVVGALLITLLVLVITLSALAPAAPKTTDIVAIIGAVTGVIGTLTAAFFGIQAAGAGRSQALTTLDNTLKNQAAVSAPTPTKLDPSYGPHAGSTRASITGNGFTGASGVNFGVTPGTNFEFVNDGLVRASSPAAGDGGDEAKVMLIFPGATPQNRAAGTFYYYTIEPHHGVGGQPVTISGSGLKDVKAVRFGQKDATPTAGPKQNQLTVTAPTLQDAGNIADVDLTLIYAVPPGPARRRMAGASRTSRSDLPAELLERAGLRSASGRRRLLRIRLWGEFRKFPCRSGSAAIRRNDRGRRDWSADNCRRGQSGSCFARWEDLRSAARFP